MARLTYICLATIALMAAVTSAAPCGHSHNGGGDSDIILDDIETGHNPHDHIHDIEEDVVNMPDDNWDFIDECDIDCDDMHDDGPMDGGNDLKLNRAGQKLASLKNLKLHDLVQGINAL
ncbi:hypothetical protein INT47_003046 [Mucor saturninus]|uniref:Uncharacterized protein n=1 Tax=Mucor saturninus TaxID=64648 RepID=A0A8H7QT76_9FUNG|nr:hypothetical protein INT47_003046 [Mucor saturninus]